MKISKLFHCLYGVVMLLPIFAIGVTCLVNTFNDSPNTNTETTIEQIPIYYETNDITTYEDFHINRAYYWSDNWNADTTIHGFDLFFIKVLSGSREGQVGHFTYSGNGKPTLYVNGIGNSINSVPFDFVITSIDATLSQIPNSLLQHFTRANGDYIKEYVDNEVITYVQNDIFYYAVDKVQQSPLFNWAYNSFLVTPFAYIVSLFSMPTNSFVVMLLSYWLAISIIWLVFDLVMYVPLLVHRWIDKGVLE